MRCVYCNEPGYRTLGEKPVCEDCYQVVKVVPDELREGTIFSRLQKLHGMLIKVPQSGYLMRWIGEISRRLDFMREKSTPAEVVKPASTPEVKRPTPTAPKPLKIKKLR